jgi:hypothetical protein
MWSSWRVEQFYAFVLFCQYYLVNVSEFILLSNVTGPKISALQVSKCYPTFYSEG